MRFGPHIELPAATLRPLVEEVVRAKAYSSWSDGDVTVVLEPRGGETVRVDLFRGLHTHTILVTADEIDDD